MRNRDNFSPEDLVTGKDFLVHLLKQALEEEHSSPQWIRSWEERNLVKAYIKDLEQIIKNLGITLKNATEIYAQQIETDTQDLEMILGIKQFTQCKKYYEEELNIFRDLLDEYRSYIWGGHVW
jgi:hypothetical protein